jgi:hypothetical protein
MSELKSRDRPQPLSGNPQGFDAVFFSGGSNQATLLKLFTAIKHLSGPNRLAKNNLLASYKPL